MPVSRGLQCTTRHRGRRSAQCVAAEEPPKLFASTFSNTRCGQEWRWPSAHWFIYLHFSFPALRAGLVVMTSSILSARQHTIQAPAGCRRRERHAGCTAVVLRVRKVKVRRDSGRWDYFGSTHFHCRSTQHLYLRIHLRIELRCLERKLSRYRHCLYILKLWCACVYIAR